MAIEDICISLKEKEGDAFCYCRNGNIEKISFEIKPSVKIPGISTPVYLLPVVNPAFANVMGSLNIDKAVFYMGLLKAEGMTQLINLKRELENSTFETVFSEDMKNIFYDKNCRVGFGITVDVITITGEHIKYVLSGENNWNYLTGCVAALAALNRKDESLKGIRYVHEVTDAKELITEIYKKKIRVEGRSGMLEEYIEKGIVEPLTMTQVLDLCADKYRDKTALVDHDRCISYRQLQMLSRHMAVFLKEKEFKKMIT